MTPEYWGRASKFHQADPNRWATAEEVPPDDRVPRETLAARLARHAEAQDAAMAEAYYVRRWGADRWQGAV
jgi:hypothetical protein